MNRDTDNEDRNTDIRIWMNNFLGMDIRIWMDTNTDTDICIQIISMLEI